MKHRILKLITGLLLLALLTACRQVSLSAESSTSGVTADSSASGTETAAPTSSQSEAVPVPSESGSASASEDVASTLILNEHSETVKQKVQVKSFVDGDTTHFYVPESVRAEGILKARYLAVNTPESTGKIEEYGKTAALFTRERLEQAADILIESDNAQWNADSSGERILVWVWYKPSEGAAWRNLNVELLQNGLAIANSSAQNRYGESCMRALEQAKSFKRGLYSGEKDPNFFYGEAQELSLREIRLHPEAYEGSKVAFEAVITRSSEGTVYVEEWDEELGLYEGISIYLGYDLSGQGLAIMRVGNRVRIVGTLQYYEAGDSWQISGLSYRAMRPEDPGNIQLISSGHEPAYPLTAPADFARGRIKIPSDEGGGSEEFDFAYLIQGTTLRMENLHVKSVADNHKNGTFTLECEAGGETIIVRCEKLKLPDGSPVRGDQLEGKTISLQGIASCYNHQYQIMVLNINDIEYD